ncbi:hypothetical protein JVU11DRAFT_4307 [Chiua virens]|nr:hypothetical protein JVU11DRAFT_4307 [Chiua virens]
MPHLGSVLLLLTLAFVLPYLKRRNCGKRRLPGPRPVPFLGNVIGIDAQNPWKTYTKWAATYGELFYTQLLGQDIVVINSERVGYDLLDRRSSNYSSRPASLYRVNLL